MVYCLLSCIGIHLHHCLAIVGYSHYWPFCVSAPIVFLHVQMSVVAIIIMYKLYTHIFHLVKALGFFGFLFFYICGVRGLPYLYSSSYPVSGIYFAFSRTSEALTV